MALGNMVALVLLATLPFHMVKAARDDASNPGQAKEPPNRDECGDCEDITETRTFKKGKEKIEQTLTVNDCNVLWPFVDAKGKHDSPLIEHCNDDRKMNFGVCGDKPIRECCARTCCNLGKTDGSSCSHQGEDAVGTVFKHNIVESSENTEAPKIVKKENPDCGVCKPDVLGTLTDQKTGNIREINDCDELRPIQEANGDETESLFKNYCIGDKKMGFGSCGTTMSTKECCARTCCDIGMTNSDTCVKPPEIGILKEEIEVSSQDVNFQKNSPVKATMAMPNDNKGDTSKATEVCEKVNDALNMEKMSKKYKTMIGKSPNRKPLWDRWVSGLEDQCTSAVVAEACGTQDGGAACDIVKITDDGDVIKLDDHLEEGSDKSTSDDFTVSLGSISMGKNLYTNGCSWYAVPEDSLQPGDIPVIANIPNNYSDPGMGFLSPLLGHNAMVEISDGASIKQIDVQNSG
eukprot:CAMPEP_0172678522 /NCGR_PEP_ID=MMETSP1074-20121228/15462_1 /TAXON_ID=2916 /ORGANISM="Ceratium fusus, Strain PA161109" /LENGTH=461 /DNA_ID=CAMNT_0013496581 /DNA_START=31 /DNA_END=1413 /DNA_ORIENTATION=-